MKITFEQLGARLKRPLAPVYVVAGGEPLRFGEAADAIRARVRAEGITEREVIVVDRTFDWSRFRTAGESLSLFTERRLIELQFEWRMRDNRPVPPSPGPEGVEALVDYAARPPSDAVLLVLCPNLGKSGGAWASALEGAGVRVDVEAVSRGELNDWIAQRMRAAGLEPTPGAVERLAERVEGNLLAAAQDIEKLRLLHGAGAVDEEAVLDAVADSARFDVFQLANAVLAGDQARALRILEGLAAEGLEPVQIVWALIRDVRDVAAVAWERATRKRSKIASAIWQSRRDTIVKVQAKAPVPQWHALVIQAAEVDAIVKGRVKGDAWEALTGFVAAFARTCAA